jgi:tol-pal system protein YbgF
MYYVIISYNTFSTYMKLATFILLAFLPFLSYADDGYARPVFEDSDLATRLDKLEHTLQTMQNSGAIERRYKAPDVISGNEAVDALNEEIKAMRGDIEQLQHNVKRLNDKVEHVVANFETQTSNPDNPSNSKSLEDMETNLYKNETTTDEDALKQKNAKSDTKNQAIDIYKAAYNALKDKNYTLASQQFNQFLKSYPTHAKAGNAHYWLGEMMFKNKEYEMSAVEYLKAYQASSKGEKAADSILKLAQSLRKISKRQEACVALSKMKKEFPNASESLIKQRNEESKALKCEAK